MTMVVVYIKQTSKGLDSRKNTHKQSIGYGQESNAIFLHLSDNDHTFDWDYAATIVPC